jgi:hypothetical protein
MEYHVIQGLPFQRAPGRQSSAQWERKKNTGTAPSVVKWTVADTRLASKEPTMNRYASLVN